MISRCYAVSINPQEALVQSFYFITTKIFSVRFYLSLSQMVVGKFAVNKFAVGKLTSGNFAVK